MKKKKKRKAEYEFQNFVILQKQEISWQKLSELTFFIVLESKEKH